MYTLYYSSVMMSASLDKDNEDNDVVFLTKRQATKIVLFILDNRTEDDFTIYKVNGWCCLIHREKFPQWIVKLLTPRQYTKKSERK